MAQLIEYSTDDGEHVLVEVYSPDGMQPFASDGSDLIKKANETLESAMSSVRGAATALLEAASDLKLPADSMEMELALKASAKAGFYLASADSEAQIKIKLIWNKKAPANLPREPASPQVKQC